MEKNKKNLIICLIILCIVIIGLCIYLIYNKDNNLLQNKYNLNKNNIVVEKLADVDSKNTDGNNNTTDHVYTNDNINYFLDMAGYKVGEKAIFKLNDNVTITAEIQEEIDNVSNITYYKIYYWINNNKIDALGDWYINFDDIKTLDVALIGDNFIYAYYYGFDIRGVTVNVVSLDGKVIKSFGGETGGMEEIYGMSPTWSEKPYFIASKDGLLIDGSRWTNGPSIVYFDKDYKSYYICDDKVKNLPQDDILTATYFYEFINGKLDLDHPKKSDIITIKEGIEEEKQYCLNLE